MPRSTEGNEANLISVGEAASILGVHPNTVRGWGRTGKLVEIGIGRRRDRRYKREDILALVSKSASTDSNSTNGTIEAQVGAGIPPSVANALKELDSAALGLTVARELTGGLSRDILESFRGLETASILGDLSDSHRTRLSTAVESALVSRALTSVPRLSDNFSSLVTASEMFGSMLAEQKGWPSTIERTLGLGKLNALAASIKGMTQPNETITAFFRGVWRCHSRSA